MTGKSPLLKNLIDFFGVSGAEGPIRSLIQKAIKPYVDDVRVDKMGNLIARIKGPGPKVMLAAHMDEIGLMVKRIEERGFIYCTAVGGIDPAAFMSNPVHIKTKKSPIHGYITTMEMSAGKYISKVPLTEEIFIDTGLSKRELLRRGVEVGSYVHFEGKTHLGENGEIVMGKALDDRLGCFVLVELVRRLKGQCEVFLVFTVQEEMGLYGAKTSTFQIEPDWGLVVDTTQANDVFPEPSREIGKGPCITIKDGEFISNPCIVGWLKQTAKKNRIPIQLEAAEQGTTDAAIIQTTKGGIPTAVVSIPVRSIHTTAGIAHMADIENAVDLLHALLKKPPKTCLV